MSDFHDTNIVDKRIYDNYYSHMYGTFKYNNAIGQIDLKLCLLCVSVFGK